MSKLGYQIIVVDGRKAIKIDPDSTVLQDETNLVVQTITAFILKDEKLRDGKVSPIAILMGLEYLTQTVIESIAEQINPKVKGH